MKKSLLFLFTLTILSVSAQNGNDKLGAWYNIGINYEINPKISWNSLSSIRLFHATNQFQQNLLRTGIAYDITSGKYRNSKTAIIIGAGIDYLHTNNYSNPELIDNNEYRTYQQVEMKSTASRQQNTPDMKVSLSRVFYFAHRLRLEQRYRVINDDYEFVSRFRYKVGLTIPLTNKTLVDKTLFFSAYEEFHFNQQKNPFEQNWTSIVLGYKLKGATSISTGYFSQVLFDVPFHRISVSFKHTFKRKAQGDVVK